MLQDTNKQSVKLVKPELRTQNSELRTQNSELRTQNSELRTQNSELRTQNLKLKRRHIFFICVLLFPFVAFVSAKLLIVERDIERADLIVVLGGSSTYLERTEEAARLWKEGRAPKILLMNDGLNSGWSNEERRNPLFVERAKKELIKHGVTEDSIETPWQTVDSTYSESIFLRDELPKRNAHSVLIVTSPYHTRRALRTMRRALDGKGIDVGILSPKTGSQSPTPYFWWLSFNGWNMVAGEYVKLVYYRFYY